MLGWTARRASQVHPEEQNMKQPLTAHAVLLPGAAYVENGQTHENAPLQGCTSITLGTGGGRAMALGRMSRSCRPAHGHRQLHQ